MTLDAAVLCQAARRTYSARARLVVDVLLKKHLHHTFLPLFYRFLFVSFAVYARLDTVVHHARSDVILLHFLTPTFVKRRRRPVRAGSVTVACLPAVLINVLALHHSYRFVGTPLIHVCYRSFHTCLPTITLCTALAFTVNTPVRRLRFRGFLRFCTVSPVFPIRRARVDSPAIQPGSGFVLFVPIP